MGWQRSAARAQFAGPPIGKGGGAWLTGSPVAACRSWCVPKPCGPALTVADGDAASVSPLHCACRSLNEQPRTCSREYGLYSRPPDASGSHRELTYGPGKPTLLAVGQVRMVDEEKNP